MTPDTLIAFDGTEQPISEHALDWGIPASRIVMRLNAGWSIENAITRPINVDGGMTVRRHADDYDDDEPKSIYAPALLEKVAKARRLDPSKLHTHNGKSLTLKEWARETGISIDTIKYRLKRGYTIAKALSSKPVRKRYEHKRYEHNSKSLTISEWSQETGISISTIRDRLKRGLTIAEAIR